MERDLPQSQTGGLKLMTVFIVVLALHVFVIGGISAYHIWRGDDKEARELAAVSGRDSTGSADGTTQDPMPPTGAGDRTAAPGSSTLAYAEPTAPSGALPLEPSNGGSTLLPPVAANDNIDNTGGAAAVPPSFNPNAGRDGRRTTTTAVPPRPIALPDSEQPVSPGLGSYTVKSGDTLQKIAQKYNVSVEDIMAINNMPQDHIRVGQKLKLTGAVVAAGSNPDNGKDSNGKPKKGKGTDATAAADKDKKNATAKVDKTDKTDKDKVADKSDARKHKVESGDTVFYLAKRYKTSVAAIRAANGLDDTVTKPKTGTVLKIPGGSTKDVAKRDN